MSDTPNLGLTYLEAAQAQKHVTVNEALRRLDAIVQLAIIDRDLAAPPAAPAPGDAYIVGASPTGAWAGHAGEIAAFQDGAWAFVIPRPGWLAFVLDEARLVVRAAAAWTEPSGALGAAMLGILTAADAVNRLAVKSNAVLFTHDDVTPGSGDVRLTLNKKLALRDAGIVFQDGYSTRALLGLLADDQLSLKVSPDGTIFRLALAVDRTTGAVALPQSPRFSASASADLLLAANVWAKVAFNTADHNVQGAFVPASNRFVAPFAGTFRLGASIGFKTSVTLPASMQAALYRNAAVLPRSLRAVAGLSSGKSHLWLDELLVLAAGDVVEVYAMMETSDGLIDQSRSTFRGHHIP